MINGNRSENHVLVNNLALIFEYKYYVSSSSSFFLDRIDLQLYKYISLFFCVFRVNKALGFFGVKDNLRMNMESVVANLLMVVWISPDICFKKKMKNRT